MEEQPKRWLSQPLTFGGVAGFAFAPFGRLVLFQAGVALLSALTIILFFERAWVPVVKEMITRLPARGSIQNGVLQWDEPKPVRVATGKFLWIIIDPTEATASGNMADLQLEFGRTELRLRSFLGYVSFPYPPEYVIALNRTGLEPWWGAWHPAVVAILGGSVLVGLLGVWALLALVYAWPIRLIAFYADRQLSWIGAWKVASAALLPGALCFVLSILAYTFHHLDLVQLIFASVLHIMVGWIYVLFVPFALPRRQSSAAVTRLARDPFTSSPKRKKNPFSDPSRGPKD